MRLLHSGQGHRPFVLRLPFLVLYLAIFALCIGLIERLLANTLSYDPNASKHPTGVSADQRRDIEPVCTNDSGWTAQLNPLEASYSNLCRDYSKTFAPSASSLSPALQSAFGQWLLQLSSITRAQTSISQSSLTCSYESAGVSYCAPVETVTRYATAGCISSLTQYDPCCAKHGTIELVSSSVITSGFPSLPCAVYRASQLAITSPGSTLSSKASTSTASSRNPAIESAVPEASQLAVTSPSSTSPSQYLSPAATSAVPRESQLAVTSMTTVTSTTSSISSSTSSKASAAVITFSIGKHEAIVDKTFTQWSYFLALYFAPMVTIVLKAVHEMIVATVKLLEPFHLLEGASHTTYPIVAQYLSSSMSKDVVQAVSQGRYLALWTVGMYLLMPLLTPIASASMSVRSRGTCMVDGVQMRCDPVWIVNITAIRCLEALTAVCCVLVLLMMKSSWRYTSPPTNGYGSIVSIAALLTNDTVLDNFRSIDTDMSDKQFSHMLEQYSFWMDTRVDLSSRRRQYELVHCVAIEEGPNRSFRRYMPVGSATNESSVNIRPKDLFVDVGTVLLTVSLLALVLTYTFDYRSDSFNTFFTSQKVLPKLIMVGLATAVDVLFKNLERVVRITEPYRRLAIGNARPETTILLPLNGTSWSNLPRCFYSLFRYNDNRMLWQTVVSTVACLSDLNVVAVTGILFTDAQTPEAFTVCSYIALVITVALCVTAALTTFWWRRREIIRSMPRRPDTIGAVISYLCGSNMVTEWMRSVRFGSLSESERYQLIVQSGYRFKFGKMRHMDGHQRWCIDIDRKTETLMQVTSVYGQGVHEDGKGSMRTSVVET